MLTEYYSEETELTDEETKEIENKIKALWNEKEEECFDKELTEILQEDEENIRKNKNKFPQITPPPPPIPTPASQ